MRLTENTSLNRYQWAAQKLKDIARELNGEKLSLFDIGARDNVLKPYLGDININYRAFDLEPLTSQAEQWDIEIPFPYQHTAPQVITMLEVIEHLKNPWLCIKNISGVIAPCGYLVLTTPNPAWSNSRINLLSSGYLSCFTQSDLELNHHVFTAWPHIVERLLADNGFEIIEYTTLDGPTLIFDKNLSGITMPFKLVSRLTKKIIELKDSTACGMSYGIVAKRVK